MVNLSAYLTVMLMRVPLVPGWSMMRGQVLCQIWVKQSKCTGLLPKACDAEWTESCASFEWSGERAVVVLVAHDGE